MLIHGTPMHMHVGQHFAPDEYIYQHYILSYKYNAIKLIIFVLIIYHAD